MVFPAMDDVTRAPRVGGHMRQGVAGPVAATRRANAVRRDAAQPQPVERTRAAWSRDSLPRAPGDLRCST